MLQCAVLASIAYYCVTLADIQTKLVLRTAGAAAAASNEVLVDTRRSLLLLFKDVDIY